MLKVIISIGATSICQAQIALNIKTLLVNLKYHNYHFEFVN